MVEAAELVEFLVERRVGLLTAVGDQPIQVRPRLVRQLLALSRVAFVDRFELQAGLQNALMLRVAETGGKGRQVKSMSI